MKVLSTLGGVLFKPGKVFEEMRDKPNWLIPLIIVLISTIALVAVTTPLQSKLALKELDEISDQMTPAQLEQARQMTNSLITLIIALVSTLIAAVIGLLIQATVFHLLGSAFGGNGRFVTALCLVGFGRMPLVLRDLLQSVYMLASGKILAPGLSTLLSAKAAMGPLGAFLGSIDLFVAWNLAILIVGLATMYRISRGKAALTVLGLWILGVGMTVVLSFIGRAFSPA